MKPIRAGDDTLASAKENFSAPLELRTISFTEGGPIPDRFAGEAGISPALSWSGVPPTAKELVLLVEDPDAPSLKPFVHWVMHNIPPTVTSLPEGLPAGATLGGAVQGKNFAGDCRYTGPKPPPGHGAHHYHFQLFALDAPLGLKEPADRDALVAAMKDHLLASGEVVGTYEAR